MGHRQASSRFTPTGLCSPGGLFNAVILGLYESDVCNSFTAQSTNIYGCFHVTSTVLDERDLVSALGDLTDGKHFNKCQMLYP